MILVCDGCSKNGKAKASLSIDLRFIIIDDYDLCIKLKFTNADYCPARTQRT